MGTLAGRASDWLEGRRTGVAVARSAATVMVLRDRPGVLRDRPRTDAQAGRLGADRDVADVGGAEGRGLKGNGVEVFMLRRVSTMAFAPRMMVFPGGGVDPRDGDPGLPWAGPSPVQWGRLLGCDEATAQELVVAAVREVFEECGVLLAGPNESCVVRDVSGPGWHSDRQKLLSRELSLAQMLENRGLVLRSDLLRARAHWITPVFEPKRYDTRVFAALMPAGQVADDQTTEADHADWTDPARLLDEYARGTALMLPPTVVCVEQVAAAASLVEFLAAEVSMETVTPVLTQTAEGVVIRCVLPGPPTPRGRLPVTQV